MTIKVYLVVGFHKDENKVFSAHKSERGALEKMDDLKKSDKLSFFNANMAIWPFDLED